MLKDVQALISGQEKITIKWSSSSETAIFNISKSFVPIKSQFSSLVSSVDKLEYTDNDVNFYFKNIEHYYIVEEVDGGSVTDTKMVCVGKDIDARIPLAMMRKKEKLFKKKLKNNCLIYIKSPEIDPCPECWDSVYQESINTNCATCGGTGRMNTYLPPLELFYNQGKSFKTTRKTQTSEVEPHTKNVEVYGFHTIKSGDIFIDKSNELWRVDNNSVEHYHSDFGQGLLVKKLDRDEPEYRILFKEGIV